MNRSFLGPPSSKPLNSQRDIFMNIKKRFLTKFYKTLNLKKWVSLDTFQFSLWGKILFVRDIYEVLDRVFQK